jgi:hypothetical protein
MGRLEGKRLLGRERHRCEGNILMDPRETGWGGVNRTNLAQDVDQLLGYCGR